MGVGRILGIIRQVLDGLGYAHSKKMVHCDVTPDNIFLFPIQSLWERFLQSEHHHVVALPETGTRRLQRTGVLELGENDRVLRLHEKPQLPPSDWVCPPLYFFQASVGSAIESFLKMDGNCDAPGHFIDYLCRREPVSAFRLESSRLDIGCMDTFREAGRFLRQNPILSR